MYEVIFTAIEGNQKGMPISIGRFVSGLVAEDWAEQIFTHKGCAGRTSVRQITDLAVYGEKAQITCPY